MFSPIELRTLEPLKKSLSLNPKRWLSTDDARQLEANTGAYLYTNEYGAQRYLINTVGQQRVYVFTQEFLRSIKVQSEGLATHIDIECLRMRETTATLQAMYGGLRLAGDTEQDSFLGWPCDAEFRLHRCDQHSIEYRSKLPRGVMVLRVYRTQFSLFDLRSVGYRFIASHLAAVST